MKPRGGRNPHQTKGQRIKMTEVGRFPEMPALFTVKEVAERLGVHRNTLRRWRLRGVGPKVIVAVPGAVLYDRSEVVEWLRQASNQALLEADRLRRASEAKQSDSLVRPVVMHSLGGC